MKVQTVVVVVGIVVVVILACMAMGQSEGYSLLGDPVMDGISCAWNEDCARGPEGTTCTTTMGLAGVCTLNELCCPSFELDPILEAQDIPPRCVPPSFSEGCGRYCSCYTKLHRGMGTRECLKDCTSNFAPY